MKEDTAAKVTKLAEVAEKLKNDLELRHRVNQNPIIFLKTLGIEVEEEFADVVKRGMGSLTEGDQKLTSTMEADYLNKDEVINLANILPRPFEDSDRPPAPTNLRLAHGPEPKTPDCKFYVNDWGLVLAISDEMVQKVVSGTLTAVEVGSELMSAFGALGGAAAAICQPVGLVLGAVGLFIGVQAVWIFGEIAMISLMNSFHHKGVYLTWTWLHLALLAYLPLPTPIT